MTSPQQQDKRQENRRNFMLQGIHWAAALIAAALLHPLLRFAGFTTPKKPQYIKVSAPLPRSGFHAERDFLLFAGPTGTWAISRTCTHLGCQLHFLEDQQIIECPCHQSRFTPQGERLAGPAKTNLPAYAVEVQKDTTGKVTSYLVTI
ncbi:MAG: ubiquinol-cytochrome c reductase iron-sulfur subunit [Candidatus Electrothrix sp. AR3]|nr:ubiquinol-cytochrome c reductase iron-sulfur subunit [Candidatus Electrothrix sp. AR3]